MIDAPNLQGSAVKTPLALVVLALLGTATVASAAKKPLEKDLTKIVSEADIGQQWLPAPGVGRLGAAYPPGAAADTGPVCVSLGYRIADDGTTSSFSELKAATEKTESPDAKLTEPFVQYAAAVVSTWKHVPASANAGKTPVYTAATLVFSPAGATVAPELRQKCEIADLQAHVEHLRALAMRRGDLNSSRLYGERPGTETKSGTQKLKDFERNRTSLGK